MTQQFHLYSQSSRSPIASFFTFNRAWDRAIQMQARDTAGVYEVRKGERVLWDSQCGFAD